MELVYNVFPTLIYWFQTTCAVAETATQINVIAKFNYKFDSFIQFLYHDPTKLQKLHIKKMLMQNSIMNGASRNVGLVINKILNLKPTIMKELFG